MADFYDKYKQNIDSLAKYQNVTTDVARDMFLSNVTNGGKYQGAGQYDKQMTVDGRAYLDSLKQQQPLQANQGNSYVNQLYDQQKQAQVQQLTNARNKATGQLNQQKAELKPQYANMRNQTDVVNLQNVQRLREAMANAGLTGSGENVTANVGLAGQRQASLDQLNLQQKQQENDIDRRISDINDPSEMNAMLSALEAERARSLLGQMNQDKQFGLQEAGLTGYYQGAPTMDYNNMMWNQNFQQGQFDWGKYMDQQGLNLNQQQFDWNKYIDQQNLNNKSSGGSSGGTSTPKPPTATQMKGSYIAEALKSDNPIKWVQEHMADLSINGINPSDVFNEVQAALKFMPKLPKDQNGNYFLNPFANPNL